MARIASFDTWGKAANNLPAAIAVADATGPYASTIHVGNGTYTAPAAGYFEINKGNDRLSSTATGITVRSENGPLVTALKGVGAYGSDRHAVWIRDTGIGAVIDGFTITNGYAYDGGGIQADTVCSVWNCIFRGNQAAEDGGGFSSHCVSALPITIRNCLFVGNECGRLGGGVNVNGGSEATIRLDNCTVTGNRTTRTGLDPESNGQGGGIGTYSGAIAAKNSIVYNNTADLWAPTNNNWRQKGGTITFTYSDTLPLPAGAGNIGVDPMFINLGSGYGIAHAGGDYRLPWESPCVNAGTNDLTWMQAGADLARNPRIAGGRVDMGAYESSLDRGTVIVIR